MLFIKFIKMSQTFSKASFHDPKITSPNLQKKIFIQMSELSARNWRFRCLVRLYLTESYQLMLTGHTATDRAETAFLQLMRGTTLHGISSFKYSKIRQSVYPKYYNYSLFLNQNN